jgi:hypothetical protein
MADAQWDRYDTGFVVASVIATIIVHPVHRILSHPYWLDEAWVGVLTKAPLSRLPRLSSSSPLGFVALLKLVPGSGLQRARLVVLAFSSLTVVMAYVLTRSLSWPSRAGARFAAIVTALVVMLVPVSLLRNDLKQYTCDAFCALAVLAVGAWADRETRRARLWWLVVTAVIAAPFSSTSAFVSVAVFAGLMASALLARNLRRALEVAAAGAVTAIGLSAYFVAAVVPNLSEKLKAYWAGQYLRGSPQHMLHATWIRLARLDVELAMPVLVFVVLFALGIAVLVKLRAHALAVAFPFLWVEMAMMGRLRRYPFLDLRTSHFLLVASFVVVAIGAVGVVQTIAQVRVPRFPFVSTGVAVIAGGIMATLFATGFARHIDRLYIPGEDVRTPTLTLARERATRDVIVVNSTGNFGFSYYWPHGHVAFYADNSGQGFHAEAAGVGAIYARGRTYPAVLSVLRQGVDRWRRAGPGARLFIVRTHVNKDEVEAWHRAFVELGVKPQISEGGSEPLLVLGPR